MIVDEEQAQSGSQSAGSQSQSTSQEEGHYEVETLAKIRRAGPKHPKESHAHQYELLVHWKGYDDITWEPLENLIHDVPDMVDSFVKQRWGFTMKQVKQIKYKGDMYFIVPEGGSTGSGGQQKEGGGGKDASYNAKLAKKVNQHAVRSGIRFNCTWCEKVYATEQFKDKHEKKHHFKEVRERNRSQSKAKAVSNAATNAATNVKEIKEEVTNNHTAVAARAGSGDDERMRRRSASQHRNNAAASPKVAVQEEQKAILKPKVSQKETVIEEKEDESFHEEEPEEVDEQQEDPAASNHQNQEDQIDHEMSNEEEAAAEVPRKSSSRVAALAGGDNVADVGDAISKGQDVLQNERVEQERPQSEQLFVPSAEIAVQQVELSRIAQERLVGKTEYIGCIFVNVPNRIIGVCKNQLQETLYLVTYQSTESEVYMPTWCQDWLFKQIKPQLIAQYNREGQQQQQHVGGQKR